MKKYKIVDQIYQKRINILKTKKEHLFEYFQLFVLLFDAFLHREIIILFLINYITTTMNQKSQSKQAVQQKFEKIQKNSLQKDRLDQSINISSLYTKKSHCRFENDIKRQTLEKTKQTIEKQKNVKCYLGSNKKNLFLKSKNQSQYTPQNDICNTMNFNKSMKNINSQNEIKSVMQNMIQSHKKMNDFQKKGKFKPSQQNELTEKMKNKRLSKTIKKAEKAKEMNSIQTEKKHESEITFIAENSSEESTYFKQFQMKYPYYCKQNKILFPIQDELFDLNRFLPSNNTFDCLEPSMFKKMQKDFYQTLEIWNLIEKYFSFFEVKENFTFAQMSEILFLKGQQFQKLFQKMHWFFFNDYLHIRYEDLAEEDCFPFINLWKYTEQNLFMDHQFENFWPKFMALIIKSEHQKIEKFSNNLQYNKYIQLLEESTKQNSSCSPFHNQSELIDYLAFLCKLIFQTSSFRTLVNDKMEQFRENGKSKTQLIDKKKNIDFKIHQLKNKRKNMQKREKEINKIIKNSHKMQIQQEEGSVLNQKNEIVEQKFLIQEQKQFYESKIKDIQVQIERFFSYPSLSNISCLGEDRNKNLYWHIKQQSLKHDLFFENQVQDSWYKIKNENINQFKQSLNQNGIREKKLSDKIQQCFRNEVKEAPSDAKEPIEIQNNQSFFLKKEEKLAIKPHIIKMILECQTMISKYLFERNSKWTTDDQRDSFIHKIKHEELENFDQLIKTLRFFNEKICVVEISIRICNDQGDEVDIKTRKIQTKIWGINEKYKHQWYDYSNQCKTISDINFLVATLYLTIEKYVKKTRKINNTKYFYKAETENDLVIQICDFCQGAHGQLFPCTDCNNHIHFQCLLKHKSNNMCLTRKQQKQESHNEEKQE